MPSTGTSSLIRRKRMKMPETIDYVAFLRFDRDASTASDEFMAKIIVTASVDKAALGVGLKSGIAELDFSIVEGQEWNEIKRIALETGGVEIIGIYRKDEIDEEEIAVYNG
jgi:hypothetical protein